MNRTKAVAAAFLGFMLLPVFAQPARVPFELVQRLAGPETQVYVGALPPTERLAFRLPTPPDTRVVGSTASPETDEAFDWVALYLRSSMTDFDFRTYYRRIFRERGWREGQVYEQGGFLPADVALPDSSLTFCQRQGDSGTDVYISFTSRRAATLIDAQISSYSNQSNWGACETQSSYIEPPLPALRAPEDTRTEGFDFFSGSSGGSGGSLIILNTKLTGTALLAHYAEQLELSGWREVTALVNRRVQLTTYRFSEKGVLFSGTLQLMALDEPGHYLAQLMVARL